MELAVIFIAIGWLIVIYSVIYGRKLNYKKCDHCKNKVFKSECHTGQIEGKFTSDKKSHISYLCPHCYSLLWFEKIKF